MLNDSCDRYDTANSYLMIVGCIFALGVVTGVMMAPDFAPAVRTDDGWRLACLRSGGVPLEPEYRTPGNCLWPPKD